MSKSVRTFRGLPVHDAEKAEIVQIKARDLSGGYTRLPNYCAVHHALCREQHKKSDEVFVHSTKAYIMSKDKKHWWRYELSSALKVQVQVHDQGGIMNEGEYRLNVVARSSRLDALREAGAERGERSRNKLVRRPIHKLSKRERPSYVDPE